MFEVEITIRGASVPFRVSGVQSVERVQEIVEAFLAAWNIPAPDLLRERGAPTLAEELAQAGEYRCEVRDQYRVIAKRSA